MLCHIVYGAVVILYLLTLNFKILAKKSAIAGEYILSVLDNGSVEVYRIYDNTKEALREIAEKENFPYDKEWTTRQLGNKLIDYLESRKEEK